MITILLDSEPPSIPVPVSVRGPLEPDRPVFFQGELGVKEREETLLLFRQRKPDSRVAQGYRTFV